MRSWVAAQATHDRGIRLASNMVKFTLRFPALGWA